MLLISQRKVSGSLLHLHEKAHDGYISFDCLSLFLKVQCIRTYCFSIYISLWINCS